MFTKAVLTLFFLFFSLSASQAQSVWMVADTPCGSQTYFKELWKEISESKYGERLKYARTVGDIKEIDTGDVLMIFTCTMDTMTAGTEVVAVGRSFAKISRLMDGSFALNLQQSSVTLVNGAKFYQILRQNRSDIIALLGIFYKALPPSPAPQFPVPGNSAQSPK